MWQFVIFLELRLSKINAIVPWKFNVIELVNSVVWSQFPLCHEDARIFKYPFIIKFNFPQELYTGNIFVLLINKLRSIVRLCFMWLLFTRNVMLAFKRQTWIEKKGCVFSVKLSRGKRFIACSEFFLFTSRISGGAKKNKIPM